VEAAPERMRKAVRAARPVTASIRERMAAVETAMEADKEVKPAAPVKAKPERVEPQPTAQVIAMREPAKPADDTETSASGSGYRQSVKSRRQVDGQQLRLF